jgi:SNF family Na+-dependent transporter
MPFGEILHNVFYPAGSGSPYFTISVLEVIVAYLFEELRCTRKKAQLLLRLSVFRY